MNYLVAVKLEQAKPKIYSFAKKEHREKFIKSTLENFPDAEFATTETDKEG